MQKYISTEVFDRVKSVITADKNVKPNKFSKVIESEIFNILTEYADIKSSDFKVSITVNDFGDYVIQISALARNLKIVGFPTERM